MTIVKSNDPNALHLKDPVAFRINPNRTELVFCNHSFSWSSSHSGLSQKVDIDNEYTFVDHNILSCGNSWDVACSRITERLAVPKVGEFSHLPSLSLYFYDGA
jgi:hypothetical protein